MAVDQLGVGCGDSVMDLWFDCLHHLLSKIGSYDKTYGSLGAVIILLLWFYLTAYVILAGAEDLEYSGLDGAFLSHCRLRRCGSGLGCSGMLPQPTRNRRALLS